MTNEQQTSVSEDIKRIRASHTFIINKQVFTSNSVTIHGLIEFVQIDFLDDTVSLSNEGFRG